MNCKGCKKNICKEYKGHKWFGANDKKYCETKFFKQKHKDQVKEVLKLIKKTWKKI